MIEKELPTDQDDKKRAVRSLELMKWISGSLIGLVVGLVLVSNFVGGGWFGNLYVRVELVSIGVLVYVVGAFLGAWMFECAVNALVAADRHEPRGEVMSRLAPAALMAVIVVSMIWQFVAH